MSAGRAIEALRLLEKQGQLFPVSGFPKEMQTTTSSPLLLQERLEPIRITLLPAEQ